LPPASVPSVQRRRLSFGAVVRARRKALGLSQEKLAEKAGCDRQSINRVENAAYSPSLDRVFKLCDALGVGLAGLFEEFDRVDSTAPTPRQQTAPPAVTAPAPAPRKATRRRASAGAGSTRKAAAS
jgi:transcriptional regulator with XRE-family HTH domain